MTVSEQLPKNSPVTTPEKKDGDPEVVHVREIVDGESLTPSPASTPEKVGDAGVQSRKVVDEKVHELIPGEQLSVEDFLRATIPALYYKAELHRGEVVLHKMPHNLHSDTQALVGEWLGTYRQLTGDMYTTRVEAKVQPSDEPKPVIASDKPQTDNATDEPSLYEPDVWMYERKANLDYTYDRDNIKIFYGAPDLCVEVAVTSASYDLNKKLPVYLEAGVKEYVVINFQANPRCVRYFVLEEDEKTKKNIYKERFTDDDGCFHSKYFEGLVLHEEAALEGRREDVNRWLFQKNPELNRKLPNVKAEVEKERKRSREAEQKAENSEKKVTKMARTIREMEAKDEKKQQKAEADTRVMLAQLALLPAGEARSMIEAILLARK